jgi:hypothetical protein
VGADWGIVVAWWEGGEREKFRGRNCPPLEIVWY